MTKQTKRDKTNKENATTHTNLFVLMRFLVCFVACCLLCRVFLVCFVACSLFVLSCFQSSQLSRVFSLRGGFGVLAPLACARPWRVRAPGLSRPPFTREAILERTLKPFVCFLFVLSRSPCLFCRVLPCLFCRVFVCFAQFSLFVLLRFLVLFVLSGFVCFVSAPC